MLRSLYRVGHDANDEVCGTQTGGVKHQVLHPLWKKKSIIRDQYALIEIYKGCF